MKKKSPTQLLICGSIAIDRIMSFSGRYSELIKPDKLHVLSICPLVDEMRHTPGGVGANISYTLALLGEKPVLLGSAGADGQAALKRLAERGVDITHLHWSEKPTASCTLMTDRDDNQIGGFYPGAMGDSESVSFLPWERQDVFCVISPHDPSAMRRQVAECAQAQMRVAYDIGQQVLNVPVEDLKAGVAAAEVLILNDYELSVLAERIDEPIVSIKTWVPVIVTTLGGQGSLIEGKRVAEPIQIGVAHPSAVTDPTGAGDAYRAGFFYGYVREWPLETCGQLGAVTASFAIEQVGTQEHVFEREALKKRFYEAFAAELRI